MVLWTRSECLIKYIPRYIQRGSKMKTTIFKNNKTQAVRIPKEFVFPDNVKHVQITAKS
nr:MULTISPECIES: AbrB/MazE/SpoVT family DNA-binding domain-containing protein [unclassified Endozoicomonas]